MVRNVELDIILDQTIAVAKHHLWTHNASDLEAWLLADLICEVKKEAWITGFPNLTNASSHLRDCASMQYFTSQSWTLQIQIRCQYKTKYIQFVHEVYLFFWSSQSVINDDND